MTDLLLIEDVWWVNGFHDIFFQTAMKIQCENLTIMKIVPKFICQKFPIDCSSWSTPFLLEINHNGWVWCICHVYLSCTRHCFEAHLACCVSLSLCLWPLVYNKRGAQIFYGLFCLSHHSCYAISDLLSLATGSCAKFIFFLNQSSYL